MDHDKRRKWIDTQTVSLKMLVIVSKEELFVS